MGPLWLTSSLTFLSGVLVSAGLSLLIGIADGDTIASRWLSFTGFVVASMAFYASAILADAAVRKIPRLPNDPRPIDMVELRQNLPRSWATLLVIGSITATGACILLFTDF